MSEEKKLKNNRWLWPSIISIVFSVCCILASVIWTQLNNRIEAAETIIKEFKEDIKDRVDKNNQSIKDDLKEIKEAVKDVNKQLIEIIKDNKKRNSNN